VYVRVDTLMKPKDIFGLAVRILGLYFLYLGLYDITQMLSADIIESPDKKDIIYALLPAVFNIVVASWLMGGGLLIRWAYPETSKVSENLPSQPKRPTPSPEPVAPPEPSGMDQAEKKLAALVEKPKDK
jgi:hypothetical protein